MKRFRRSHFSSETAPAETDVEILQPGITAPAFSLPDKQDQIHTLAMYRGQPVILAFYPADGSPVCTDQLVLYNEALPIFDEYKAQLLGISTDSQNSHRAFAEQRNLKFPLLSDAEPKGAVTRQYGVYDAERGTSRRALFVIDRLGFICWSHLSPSNVNPGADGILRALEQLKGQSPT
jgi:peroxiredoxin